MRGTVTFLVFSSKTRVFRSQSESSILMELSEAPMNFNTANSTLRQLMANGLCYRVPMFQRDYAWGADEWADLWQDMVALVDEEDAEPAHYMGYLVLQSPNNREFDIIDGQQRMTTMSVLILAAVAHLMDLSMAEGADSKNRQRADQLRNSYIGYLDPVTLVPQSKLTLNKNNDRFYQHYLVPLEQPLRKQGLSVSENLLRQAFFWFKDRMKKQSGGSGIALARFIDVLVDKLFFTVITVTDELNAFKVFETLNVRGVRLSATDLLKNYLFSVVSRDKPHAQDIKDLEDRWDSIVDLLGSERFPEFLRTFWNSRNKLVRKAELFKVIRNGIRDKAAAFTLICQLDRSAQVYVALRKPEQGSDWTAEECRSLEQLRMFSVRQPLALLLAVFERFGEQDRHGFQKFLRAIAILSFRYNVICGRQSKEQEGIYNQVAQDISSSKIKTINEALSKLRPIYPDDREFEGAFAEKTLQTTSPRNKKVVRFVLFALEKHASGNAFEIEDSHHTIEHVLPENPGDDWCQFDEQQQEIFTYRLGNMTILKASENRELNNSAYDEKRLTYGKSDFNITRNLAERYDQWTVEKICANQRWMAKQATSIWRVDFP